jgi:Ser/Thr protein kinase RdoA (MazF antagonist)
MERIAGGRDCEIFDAGPGRVFRRPRDGRSLEGEARVMQYVRDHGYPAPAVLEVRADGLVLERVEGPTMVAWALRAPWRLRRAPHLLSDLHDRLHAIPAPDWLPVFDAAAGDDMRVLHFDLHPLNVLMSPQGPVVIDWTNARRGSPAADAAQTWVIVATSEPEGVPPFLHRIAGAMQGLFVRRFLAGQDAAAARRHLPEVAKHRKRDRNILPSEVVRIDELVAREGVVGEK